MPHPPTPAAEGALVARLPIFDRDHRVVGYEVRHQPAAQAQPAEPAGRVAARVLSDAILTIGLDTLVGDKLAFVTVTPEIILSGLPDTLPPSAVVLQLAGQTAVDAALLDACRALRRDGYAIAIDDFSPGLPSAGLASLATYVKIDSAVLTRQQPAVARGLNVVAKGVDRFEIFQEIGSSAALFFQGRCLGQPLIASGRRVPGSHVTCLRLLRALNDPNLSMHDLEQLIKPDVALCHRILRTVNSAAFALRRTVDSIRDAVLLLGRDTIRRWASLWLLAGLGGARPELVAMATVRARCTELLGAALPGDNGAVEGFLLGLCSMLDVILGRAMADVLAELPLDATTAEALRGRPNVKGRLLRCAIAYERGQFDESFAMARELGLNPDQLPVAYAEALRWSRELQAAERVA